MVKSKVIKYAAIVVAGVIGPIALAQAQGAGDTSQTTMPKTEAPPALAKADRNFVDKAARAGLAEVAEAQIALQKSSNADIQKFAQRMVNDHTKAGDQLTSVAETKGINLPTAMSRADKRKADALQKLSGSAFDRRYVSDQTAAHKEAVSLFATESKNGKDAGLKSFAAQTLPTLEDHYRMIQSISGYVANVHKSPSTQQ